MGTGPSRPEPASGLNLHFKLKCAAINKLLSFSHPNTERCTQELRFSSFSTLCPREQESQVSPPPSRPCVRPACSGCNSRLRSDHSSILIGNRKSFRVTRAVFCLLLAQVFVPFSVERNFLLLPIRFLPSSNGRILSAIYYKKSGTFDVAISFLL